MYPKTGVNWSVYVEEAKWPNYYCSLAPKDSHTDMVATLGNNAPPYAIVKRLMAEFMSEISDLMRHCFLGMRKIVIILAHMSHWFMVSYCDR